VYEGEMHDGVRDGNGICLYNNNTLYEGQWKKNREHGIGTLMSSDRKRVIYQGAWEKGRMHGHGVYNYYSEGIGSSGGRSPRERGNYVGQFRQSLRNGRGVFTLPDGSVYDGEFRDNIQNGYGVFHWPDGTIYEGPWRDGKRHGAHGILVASDGFRYEGSWVNNTMEGRGVATYPKGQVYDGTWVAGRREGRGTIRFTNGAICESTLLCSIVFVSISRYCRSRSCPVLRNRTQPEIHGTIDEGRFKDDYMEGQGTMKMNRNVLIPRLVPTEDEKQSGSNDGSDPLAAAPSTDDAVVTKHDWMIPLQFQSDISHIHQKAGFTQIGM
jgi:hypothetical protein